MIYLDAAVTVPTSEAVRELMSRTLQESWGNVSGAHSASRKAKNVLEEARENFANNLGVSPDNVVFTSGATESLNIAIQGFGRAHPQATIFYSAIEHPAVSKPSQYFSKRGHEVVSLGVNSSGILNIEELENVQPGDLVCVMPVNNEIGVINDVEKISKIVHERGAYLLLDCVQTFYAFDPKYLCGIADFAVFSSHKLGGPQGVGLLVIKNRKLIDPLSFGGSQEWELRPGTTPAFLISAFAFVMDNALANRHESISKIEQLQRICIEEVTSSIPQAKIHAIEVARTPHIVSVDFGGVESQMLVAMVDSKGVCVSRGSACASGASTPSPVLLALGIQKAKATSTLRLSFHPGTQESEVIEGIRIISECVTQLQNSKSMVSS